MDRLRTPFFLAAMVLIVAAFGIEVGALALVSPGAAAGETLDLARRQLAESGMSDPEEQRRFVAGCQSEQPETPPGLGIPAHAPLDALLLLTVGLMGSALLVPERVQGRVQGILTFVVALLALLASVAVLIGAFVALQLMLGLFLAPPFGTIAYLVLFGSFATGRAQVVLALAMTLKLAFAGCLIAAHQRFLQNKGLILIVLTSLLATLIVSFLHGLVPPFLVSITDAVAALIVGILALIWSVLILLGSLVGIVKAVTG